MDVPFYPSLDPMIEHMSKPFQMSESSGTGAGGGQPKKAIFDGIKRAPDYPEGFRPRTGNLHTTKNTVKNKQLLDQLREIEKGDWKKVYKDGIDASGNRISIHFFQSRSGKVYNVKVKSGWSN